MEDHSSKMKPCLSPLAVLALAVGSSVGWGAFIMTGMMFLPSAGPIGSVIGLFAGALIMILIFANYRYMMVRCPESGGTYAIARTVFGHDHGFLVGWFLALAYISMLWANATALQLFSRILLGNLLEFGFHYTVAGFEVYFGELLIISILIVFFAFICIRWKKVSFIMITVLVSGLLISSIVLSVSAGSSIQIQPAFSSGMPPVIQVLRIISLAPWAYIGFESISHYVPEFQFKPQKSLSIGAGSLIISAAIYSLLTLLASAAAVNGISDWHAFASHVSGLTGIDHVPTFSAAAHHLDQNGITILIIGVLCTVLSTFIGMFTASSRLYYAMAEDGILPEWFGRLNRDGVPANSIIFCAVISCLILFFGRTAIEWVVDITTMGGAIAYGYTSLAAWRTARAEKNRRIEITGLAGFLISVWFGLNFMFPQLPSAGSLAPETYLILTFWLVFGFVFFRHILQKDQESKKFGNSIIVWLMFMVLAYGASLNWTQESTRQTTNEVVQELVSYYTPRWDSEISESETAYLNAELEKIEHSIEINSYLQLATMLAIIILFFNVYSVLRKRQEKYAEELGSTRDTMYRDPLTGVKSKHAHKEKREEINRRIEEGTMGPFAVAVCDVNNLKIINDRYGHKEGDAYIRSASATICRIFKHSPVYRIGGDEFSVLLEGEDYDHRKELITELNRISDEHVKTGEVIIAAGISDYEPGKDPDAVIVFERADHEMYLRKQSLKAMEHQKD